MRWTKLKIDRVGAHGDGIAQTDNGLLFIPFTLEGELVFAKIQENRGTCVGIIEPDIGRIPPVCEHFGTCGGCVVQHMGKRIYLDWKLDIAQKALDKNGIDYNLKDIMSCNPGERRRIVLTAKRTDQQTILGYQKLSSHETIAIHTCPVSHSRISENFELFQTLADIIIPRSKSARLTILLCENGLDIAISGNFTLQDKSIRALIQKITAGTIIKRLTFNDDIIIQIEAPVMTFGDTLIAIPPGSFVQAGIEAQNHMVKLVSNHLKSCKRVADLFSGCGTFTFPLAHKSHVHAVETSGAALNAIDHGFRSRQGLKPVTTQRRDLFKSPLVREELKQYQGVVFDPPRKGAHAQSKQLARSDVQKIAAVSCNPTSLARDLAILTAAGFLIKSITVIDQFLWSPHIEMVALLER